MKFKKIESNYYITLIDRLTRFKPANVRYSELFDLILSKHYMDINLKKLSIEEKIDAAVEIINQSSTYDENDDYLNKLFIELEKFYFKENQESYQYLSNRLNIYNVIKNIQKNSDLKRNVLWLKKIAEEKPSLDELKNQDSNLYPVKKVILCEGQTELILLETIFNLYNINFINNGIYVLAAGGKNRVAKKYYSMCDIYKVPFFILLDSDATETKDLILTKKANKDKLYILKSGEFEDILPKNLIISALNDFHKNDYTCSINDFIPDSGTVDSLELIYRKYGFGEFKKADFAEIVDKYIQENCTKSDFLDSEIEKVITEFQIY